MRLAKASVHFHNTVASDAYDLARGVQFLCGFNAADDAARDNVTVARRVVSVAPETEMPPRRTVLIDGDIWLLGAPSKHYFNGRVIAHNLVAHRADDLGYIRSFSDAISGAGGTPAYGAKVWLKGMKEVDISSDIVNEYEAYFSVTETLTPGALVYLESRWNLVRAVRVGTTGILLATVDELPEPVVVTANFDRRTYTPATDSYVVSLLSVSALRLRWQSHFRYLFKAVEAYQPGDMTLMILKSAHTPTEGDRVVINGDEYRVNSYSDETPCWLIHLRNA